MFVCGECGWAQPTAGRCNDGTTLVPIGDDLLLGTSLGPYRIARLLGVGGMGRVYKGVHPQIGSRVAIKVLSRECTDRPDLVERFFAEARAVNLVSHEGIVNVLDLSVLPDGRPYIIMEYLDGAPLSSIIDGARQRNTLLPVGSVARMTVEVLDALAAAHAKGVVHRDLKPDNIFVTPGGRPKVLDFGIAKLQPELGGNSATHTGSLLGTPQYMAPEQASGRSVDARADLYAIGCILYECMTLHRPFVADSLFDLLRKHIEEPVRPPRELRPDLPPDVEHVIVIALSKLPEHRFSSAAAMSQALQHATAALPPEQWAPMTPLGSTAPVRSNPSWGARQQQPARSPAPLHAPLGQASTVASDPNVPPPQHPPHSAPPPPAPARAGKGWIVAIVAIIVVGGGVTAVVVAGRGDASAQAVARADEPPPRATHAKHAKSAKHGGDDDDDVDDDDIDRQINQIESKVLKDVDQQLDAVHAQLGGAARPPPKPLVPAPAPPPPTAGLDAGAAAPVEAPTVDELHTPDGWLVRHELRPPPGYDVEKVDVAAFVTFAVAEAKKSIPDAQLIRVDVQNVDATGHANLALPTHSGQPGDIDVRFVSPSHIPPHPTEHKPFGFEWKCELRIVGSPQQIEIYSDGMPCIDEKPLRMPRCPITDLFKRAAAKLPAGQDRVELDYRVMFNGVPTWNMAIYGLLEESYSDDCK